HYRAALSLLEAGDPRRGELLLGLGDAAVLAGAEHEAAATFAAAQAWFQRAGEPVAAAGAAHRLGQAWARLERHEQARTAFEAALALLEDRPGPELIQVLVDLGGLLAVSLHEQAAGIEHSRRALELAQRLGDERLLAAASRSLGNLLVRSNDLAAGVPLLERALALAEEIDDPAEGAECCACLAAAFFWLGAIRRCREVVQARQAFAERCRDPYELRHVHTWLAVCDGMQGRMDAAERRLDQAQAIVEPLASLEPRAYLHFCRGALLYFRGE